MPNQLGQQSQIMKTLHDTMLLTPLCVCIIAYNEERHIALTIDAIIDGTKEYPVPVYVYANGCTDRTVEICSEMSRVNPNIHVRELSLASKSNAWNTAFEEQHTEFILFSDGDILPEPGAVMHLLMELKASPDAVVASSRQLPLAQGLSFQRKMVGFMQLPLMQQFLYGGFYLVRRKALSEILRQKGFAGLPVGITAEDGFIEYVLTDGQLLISGCRTYYEPPNLRDYMRYLARIRWQNEQLRLVLGHHPGDDKGYISQIIFKIAASKNRKYTLVALCALLTRYVFKTATYTRVKSIYRSLGPVCFEGDNILGSSTRAHSTK
jgi:glycosyltransferase involved in cell wall biosynthesis